MKNLIASFVIFFVLIISMIFSINYLNKRIDHYTKKVNYMEDVISKESWDEAYKASMEFIKEWDKDSETVSVFINHTHVDSINSELLKLTQYIKYKDKSESLALVHEIKFLIEEILDVEKVTLANVF
ncbi:MAG: DUF4363 family protein [Clostridium sp.]|nr:DUF4363 family protein [Clostridium sp.]